ncbi:MULTISPECIES: 2-C-methyl-D-erythritol 2,4-cyclodiphosphate synthase [Nosocomiicoccus]|uniref:2-C-methyl-D-erythritol 2,4-cyclodiphosphate synthase n=1 Tax=Nosocomiicoccus massiliensis TaxID=1232430 RepID=A0AAF1BS42_9STAP|nr:MULTISPECIES: 2-C-methyl-D-erythritol 2,4-cyclodiphosphate synthase [Nosocomiicoccus]MDK6863662.1 2-C-methyl-D-erythritol 2,4-cyclodiphosphate synthase [Nosocomiicoccus ampullae]OFL49405.1 2-C-methyl-D-erythritol 2,4-cyclodiphosphate synthase [Nosocomiicoccus sp. HMSC067E10]WOS95557.1 2-C-methyl-D-erythritol 2,4-cyclodiphosphate synthase [Nosocomiicoccus massiliensis]
MRIGHGYDVHQLKKGRPLIIGGLEIEHEEGLDGHSDADVLLHTIADSILGALALGDIGKFFPDNDPKYKDMDSQVLLSEVVSKMTEKGYEVGNVDAVIIAEAPKFRPYIDDIRQNVARLLDTTIDNVNVKATTHEKLGALGRKEGIASEAVILLKRKKANNE